MALLLAFSTQSFAQQPPALGASPRIDAIKQAKQLRVGVLVNPPWLWENTTGSGEGWDGPAWTLAKEYARLLGVDLVTVPVSNDTKVPVLAANQADMTIAPLAETPDRLKVVDFVVYSSTSVCMFGLASNPKFANAKSVDDLNRPDITLTYLVGAAEELWVKHRFPKAQKRGQISSSLVPIDEVVARRADAGPVNRVQWLALSRRVKGLAVLPKENNCQDSNEKAQPVGLAIDKNQPTYLDWLRAVATQMAEKLKADELRIIQEKL
ncbi:substrate-binding periplasmic protein [Bradyrhizobium brasilense]|uniref:substrate-binding periplasmic protein n=1 Tax=Bradyrhizobium brasilense TaxID=1419277 RepID=UPI001E63C3BD|nr:transporter substrate-binding domain-containing protein [Bradyrhizobium brasilense]